MAHAVTLITSGAVRVDAYRGQEYTNKKRSDRRKWAVTSWRKLGTKHGQVGEDALGRNGL